MVCLLCQSVVPLSPAQHVQLNSATDFTGRFDEAALYPLLHNAWEWQDQREAGAVVPDYGAMRQAPNDYRGHLCLIEGLFAGVPKGGSLKVAPLSRAGPWDDRLEQWGIVVDQEKDRVAVVYLVSPPPPPAAGTPVRLVARFYKVLADTDLRGQPTDFLTFVGKSATVQSRARPQGSPWTLGPLWGVLLLLAAGWYVLRRSVGASPQRWRASGQGPEAAPPDEATVEWDNEAQPLPKNPAEALASLHRVHEEEESP